MIKALIIERSKTYELTIKINTMLEAYKEKSSDNAKLRIDEDQLITGVAEK